MITHHKQNSWHINHKGLLIKIVTKTNGNEEDFLNHFQQPRFASGYDQNQIFLTDVSNENNHQVLPKLTISVPMWDKRSNQWKTDKSF